MICVERGRNGDVFFFVFFFFFFFQAEDGIRNSVASRGLGDVYKRQLVNGSKSFKYDLPERRRLSPGCARKPPHDSG